MIPPVIINYKLSVYICTRYKIFQNTFVKLFFFRRSLRRSRIWSLLTYCCYGRCCLAILKMKIFSNFPPVIINYKLSVYICTRYKIFYFQIIGPIRALKVQTYKERNIIDLFTVTTKFVLFVLDSEGQPGISHLTNR
jgi:hypothetical protein